MHEGPSSPDTQLLSDVVPVIPRIVATLVFTSWATTILSLSTPVLAAKTGPDEALDEPPAAESTAKVADENDSEEADVADEAETETSAFADILDALEYRGNLTLEISAFTADAEHSAGQQTSASVSGEVEFYYPLPSGDGSFLITPFARIDQHDSNRTHFDFREFLYQRNSDDWEFRAGLGKVFWGVAESRNPVDIINQRDSVEGITVDEKLGQPMVQFSWIKELGSLDFFILPGFRERTFASSDGRPRATVPIRSNAIYESDRENRHIDIAARYSMAIEEWDLGFSAFRGTERAPLFIPQLGSSFTDISLQPLYYQVLQIGFDAQATLESWLLKFEWIHQQADAIDSHAEFVTGFEYSFYGIGETDTDLGIIAEYLYDNRGESATQPFQNDLLLGMRLALNDEASSEALLGGFFDLDTESVVLTVEASRRLGNSFKVSLEAVSWLNTSEDASLDQFRNEDFVQAEVSWFF